MERQQIIKTKPELHERKKLPSTPSAFPSRSPAQPYLQLQRHLGNDAFGRFIQAKLKISQPGDMYEQEADRVAEQVMRMPEPTLNLSTDGTASTIQRKCAACSSGDAQCPECADEEEKLVHRKPLASEITPLIQRQATQEPEEEEEETLQTKPVPGGISTVSSSVESHINSLRGGGQPLPPTVRAFFEPRFGCGFGHVRVHTDGQSMKTANALNAQAFTLGRDMVFGAGKYAPETAEGKKLLAHELTHVVQQKSETTGFVMLRESNEPERTNKEKSQATDISESVRYSDLSAAKLSGKGDFPELATVKPSGMGHLPKSVKQTPFGIINNAEAYLRDPDKKSSFMCEVPICSENGARLIGIEWQWHVVIIPTGEIVQISEDTITDKTKFVKVRWDGKVGWTARSNLDWRKRKRAKIPPAARVAIIDADKETDTIIGEAKYFKVRWDSKEGWTARSNLNWFDPAYMTTYDEGTQQGKALTGDKSTRIRYEQKKPESFISADEGAELDNIVGIINNKEAYKRDPATGESLAPESIDLSTKVVVMETRRFGEGKGELIIAGIMDFEANECWTLYGNIALGSLVRKEGLITERLLDEAKKNRKVMEALQQRYGAKIQKLLESKSFTTAQSQLLQRADDFVQNSALQSKYPCLVIPHNQKVEGNIILSEDLIQRLNAFFRFLLHEKLIDGFEPKSKIWGARSYSRAHELSTRWMLNKKSQVLDPFEDKKKFVSKLIEIDGKDQTANVTWASELQVSELKKLMIVLEKPESGTERTEADVKNKDKIGAKSLTTSGVQSLKHPEVDPKTEIEKIVNDIRSQEGTQGALAMEGYPIGDKRRKPNILTYGVSPHCGGEAIDISFNFRFNYFDPIIDAIALVFGLRRPAKELEKTPEYWHYMRVGVPMGEQVAGEEAKNVES